MHNKNTVALKPNLRVPCCYVLDLFKYAYFSITLRLDFIIFKLKIPKDSLSSLGLKCCLQHCIPC